MKSVTPFSYHGKLQVPYSKSYLQRAIAVSLLAKQEVVIQGFTPGNDAIAARGIAETLRAETSLNGNELKVIPKDFFGDSVVIHCGESGLSTRMFSPIAASLSQDAKVTGEGSILVRPMDMVIDALEQLGAKVSSNDQKLPLHILGGISCRDIEIDGSESSQLLTGLLIALSFLPGECTVRVKNLRSIPYVQMTLDILHHFGVEVKHNNYEVFFVPQRPEKKVESYTVEGDWSGASFHVVGAAISGQIELLGLNQQSAQADKEIINAVQKAGADVTWKNGNVVITRGGSNAIEFDATHCPDLFPPLAALAAASNGTSVFKGVSRLASKESNRGLTIQSELKKLGIEVKLEGDLMYVTGGNISAGTIDSNNDHRIAMMGAILATRTSDKIEITGSEAVNKSYPDFFNDIERISKNGL